MIFLILCGVCLGTLVTILVLLEPGHINKGGVNPLPPEGKRPPPPPYSWRK